MNTQNTGRRRGPKPNLDTRENLISAGLEMLHSGGYAATGIKDIVDAAKVPKGSFYNHFESKEIFGKEVVDSYFNSGLYELRSLLNDKTVPPLSRLRTYFAQKMQASEQLGYTRGCLLGNMSLEVADHSSEIRGQLAAHFTTWGDLIEQCIREAQQNGQIKNPIPALSLARFILNSWEGALLRMRVEKSEAALKDFHDVVFDVILI